MRGMATRNRSGITAAGRAVRDVLGNPGIRRIELAWTAGIAADAALLVALLVAAFQAGGPLAVGIVGLALAAPAIVVGPLATVLAGRLPPARLLLAVHAVRGAGAVATSLVLASAGSLWVIVLLTALSAAAGSLVRPLQVAAMPSYARSPGELVGANVGMSIGEGVGVFGGSLGAGLVVATGGPSAAAAVALLLFAASVAALIGLRMTADELVEHEAQLRHRGAIAGGGRTTIAQILTAGPTALARSPAATAVMFAFGAQVFVRGLSTVLIVVAAIDLLGLGESGVGLLTAAYGLGGLGGAIAGVGLAGRRSLGPTFGVALALWGLPLAAIGLLPLAAVGIAALFVSGFANAVLDVAGYTLLQRTVPTGTRLAVFAFLESVIGVLVPAGSLVVPALIASIGQRGALVVAGVVLPVVAVATWPRIRRADDALLVPERELTLLRGIPLFDRLPLTALERIAGSLQPASHDAGEVVMAEGEPGDRYFVIESGEVEVTRSGRPVAHCGPGEGIGEISLLHAVPRTATVTALSRVSGFYLSSPEFLAAIAGPTSTAAAHDVAAERLARSAD